MNTGLHSQRDCVCVMVPVRLLSSLRGRAGSSSSRRLVTALSAAGGSSDSGTGDGASLPSRGSTVDSSMAGNDGSASTRLQPPPRRRKAAGTRQQQGGSGLVGMAGTSAAAGSSRRHIGQREFVPYSPRFEGPSYSTSAANMESGVVHGAKVVGAALVLPSHCGQASQRGAGRAAM